MIAAAFNNILDGSHYTKDTANRFNYIVVENKPFKQVRTKNSLGSLTRNLLRVAFAGYYAVFMPEMVSLLFSVRRASRTLRKLTARQKVQIVSHAQYGSLRSQIDSMTQDVLEIKRLSTKLSAYNFPLKGVILTQLSGIINLIEKYIADVNLQLKKLNKPVLDKYGSKVLPEAKQWQMRVKAYEFVA